MIHKRFDADSRSFTVVGDLLMGDTDVVKVFERLGSLAQGKPEVDMECEAQGHDMCVVFAEPERHVLARNLSPCERNLS